MFFARGYKSAQTKHGSKFSSFFFVPQLRINPRRFTLFSIFKTQPSSPFHVLLCLIVWVSVRQYFHLSGHTRDLVSSKALTVDTNDLPIFSSPSSWSLTLSNRYWSQEPGGQLLRLGRYCDQCLTSCLSTWPRPSRLPPLQPATETARGLNWWAGHTCLAITSHLISSMYVGNISKISNISQTPENTTPTFRWFDA